LNGDLRGYIAVVTGARIKIGFTVALRLLRSGAIVIGTTRFSVDALDRFKQEKDYSTWKDNLILYSLNLMACDSILQFVEFVKQKFKRIHILINNAAQTVRKPYFLYQKLIEKEESSKSEDSKKALMVLKQDLIEEDQKPKKWKIAFDNFGEPFVKSAKNTWKKSLEEVSQRELLEVQLVNNIAPTILLQQLSPLLKVTKEDLKSSYVINVTSHEGQFFTDGKTDFHIHNNMSKSALNMLTRSSAEYYSQLGIYLNSVDTGWISSSIDTFVEPPLTCEDGASRILYPIYTKSTTYGQLLKNYVNTPW
jgi:NAD(P)-dependent dehydrogenase (short-subunit alcohol dehydrogenase family)